MKAKTKKALKGRQFRDTIRRPRQWPTAFECLTSTRQQGREGLSLAKRLQPEQRIGNFKASTPRPERPPRRLDTHQRPCQEHLPFHPEFRNPGLPDFTRAMTQHILKSTPPSRNFPSWQILSMRTKRSLYHLPPPNLRSPKPLLSPKVLWHRPGHPSRHHQHCLSDRPYRLFLQSRHYQFLLHFRLE